MENRSSGESTTMPRHSRTCLCTLVWRKLERILRWREPTSGTFTTINLVSKTEVSNLNLELNLLTGVADVSNMTKVSKYLFIFNYFVDGESIGNNRLLDTLPSWGPEFQITFDIKMTSFAGSNYKSIISFTSNPGHCCDVGDRIPAILLKMDTKQLHVGTQIDSNGNSWANSKRVEINTWYNLKITQKLDSSDGKVCTYLYLLYIC